MSRTVEAKELHHHDMFEMPNGSLYTVGDEAGHQARLCCAHPPDPITFDPPFIDLPPAQQVRLLSGREAEAHAQHAGYVEAVFRGEMDRRHVGNMQAVGEKRQREAAAQHQREHASRPWWKKLFD